jgi:hypothetical protein
MYGKVLGPIVLKNKNLYHYGMLHTELKLNLIEL